MGGLPPLFDAAFDVAGSSRASSMKQLHKRALGNAGAAVAGVVIGGLVVVLFFFLCIWPIIRRYVREYRERRHGHSQEFDPETGDASHLAGDALTGSDFDRPRRLPSSDSLKLPDDHDDARHHHHRHTILHTHHAAVRGGLHLDDPSAASPSKNSSWPAHDGSRALADGEGQLHLHQYQYPIYPEPAMVVPIHSSLPHDSEHQNVPSPGTGDLPLETPPEVYQTHNLNEDYYNPSIPSEAFGMITTPEPKAPTPASRSRSTSITQQVKQIFQRRSQRERNLSTSTTGSESRSRNINISYSYDASPVRQIADEDLVPSPIEGPPNQINLPPSVAQPQAGNLGPLTRTPSISSPPEHRLKTSPSPPAHPAPGTVNPMDIMPASTESELWHRTEHQLYISSYESPPQFSSFMKEANMGNMPAASSPSPLPDASQPPTNEKQPSNEVPNMWQNMVDTMSDEELAEKDDVVMFDVPTHGNMSNYSSNHLSASLNVGSSRRPSNPSEHSTPFPGAASTDASSHNTPSTLLDSPSPASVHSSDFRHSASPQLVQSVPSEKTTVFRCDELGCNQVFDQPHKLKHHQRYHSKDHKCPYPACGKGFGTKTHLQRHINDRHEKKKKFHCAIPGCDYSRAGGKAFPRKDNWKRHMTKIHNMDQHNLPEPVEVE